LEIKVLNIIDAWCNHEVQGVSLSAAVADGCVSFIPYAF